MYHSKVFICHLPMRMLVYTDNLSNFITIAEPDLMEWFPMSVVLDPNFSLPVKFYVALREVLAPLTIVYFVFPSVYILSNVMI